MKYPTILIQTVTGYCLGTSIFCVCLGCRSDRISGYRPQRPEQHKKGKFHALKELEIRHFLLELLGLKELVLDQCFGSVFI